MSAGQTSAQLLATLREVLGGALEAVHLPVVESTNSELKARLRQGALSRPTLLYTDDQPRGRGTRGRSWQMQPGLDVALTLALPLAAAAGADPRLSLAVGAAVALALEGVTGLRLAVKWPNDILAGAPGAWRKCGGILLETCPAPADGARWLLAGVGINVNSASAMFAPELAGRLATLQDARGAVCDRGAVVLALASGLAQALLGVELAGVPALAREELLRAWFARDCSAGGRYRLTRDGRTCDVTATGVERATGYLRCAEDDGTQYVVASYTELEQAAK